MSQCENPVSAQQELYETLVIIIVAERFIVQTPCAKLAWECMVQSYVGMRRVMLHIILMCSFSSCCIILLSKSDITICLSRNWRNCMQIGLSSQAGNIIIMFPMLCYGYDCNTTRHKRFPAIHS